MPLLFSNLKDATFKIISLVVLNLYLPHALVDFVVTGSADRSTIWPNFGHGTVT